MECLIHPLMFRKCAFACAFLHNEDFQQLYIHIHPATAAIFAHSTGSGWMPHQLIDTASACFYYSCYWCICIIRTYSKMNNNVFSVGNNMINIDLFLETLLLSFSVL